MPRRDADLRTLTSTSHGLFGRREFLTATAAALLTATACGRKPYDRQRFSRPARSPVGLFPAQDYSDAVADVVYRGIRDLAPPVTGRRVLLKPNMVEFERDTAINTHAIVVAGAADAFLRLGAAEVVIGEGPGHRRDVEYLLGATGLIEYLRDRRLSFVDLNHDDVVWTDLRSGFTGLGQMALPAAVLRADLVVSMPKLKTHHWAVVTAGMKNLFGVVPGAVYGWPKNVLHMAGIENSILDIAATVQPQFTIVDGIVGMEGDGPIMGKPRHVGVLLMGTDVVAVDATCARVMGFDPARIRYLGEAGQFLGNIAESRIEMRGERLERFAASFERPPSMTGGAAG
jgi:uncharacterized protein (DUF362 family)